MSENYLKLLKSEKCKYPSKKLAYPYNYFNSIDDYQEPVNNMKKEDFFKKLKRRLPQ